MHQFLRPLSRIAAAILACLSFTALASEKAPPPARPALWKIADADTTIYLFGTVHVLPPGIDWFGGKVAAAFDGSQELVTEIIDDEAGATRSGMFQRAALPQGETTQDLPAIVDLALRNNPDTRRAWEDSRVAAARYGRSLSGYYPEVSVEASATRPSSAPAWSAPIVTTDGRALNGDRGSKAPHGPHPTRRAG